MQGEKKGEEGEVGGRMQRGKEKEKGKFHHQKACVYDHVSVAVIQNIWRQERILGRSRTVELVQIIKRQLRILGRSRVDWQIHCWGVIITNMHSQTGELSGRSESVSLTSILFICCFYFRHNSTNIQSWSEFSVAMSTYDQNVGFPLLFLACLRALWLVMS